MVVCCKVGGLAGLSRECKDTQCETVCCVTHWWTASPQQKEKRHLILFVAP